MKRIDLEIVVIWILVLTGVVLVVGLVWYALSEERIGNENAASCRDSGYIGIWTINGVDYCYGYVEGNHLITEPLEDVKARAGK